MIKIEESIKPIKNYRKFCDVCDKEIRMGLACSAIVCNICGRDLCDSCVEKEKDICGDYREGWCKSCWGIGKPFLEIIDKLKKEIELLEKTWNEKANRIIKESQVKNE